MDDKTSNDETKTARVREYPLNIRDALAQRGHDLDDELTPADAFDEFCDWHGLTHWGQTLREALDDARATAEVSS